MALKLYNETDIEAIADAIRGKNGSSDTYKVSEMADAIDDIPTGGGSAVTGDQYFARYLSTDRMDVYDTFNSDTLKPAQQALAFGAHAETLCFWNMTGSTSQYSSQWIINVYAKTLVMPKVTRLCADFIKAAPYLEKLDVAPTRFDTNAIRNSGNLATIIIRSSDVPTLGNNSVFSETAFASSGTGGTFYVPRSLISSYQSATNWSTVLGYANNSIQAIEGSQYENYYADGTPIS